MPYNDPTFNPGGKNYVAPAPPPVAPNGMNYAPPVHGVQGHAGQLDISQINGSNGQNGWFVDPSLQNNAIDQAARYQNAGYSGGPTMQAATLGPASMASAASLDQTQADQARGYQTNLLNTLGQTIAGNGPSIAATQQQQGLEQALAQQQAAAASMPGQANPGMMQRNLAMQGGAQAQALIGQQALARMQEQNLAQQQYGGLASALRGADLGAAGQNANFQQQTNLANQGAANQYGLAQAGFQQQAAQSNLGAQQQTQQQNAQQGQYYYGQAAGQREADRQALIARGQQGLTLGDQNAQKDQYSDQKFMKMAGGVAAGAAMVASDERLKTDVRPADEAIGSFLDALGSHSYVYKDEKHGKGRHVSPMAQELERTELGRAAVVETPEGKMVDYGRLSGVLAASASTLNKRVRRLEEALGAR